MSSRASADFEFGTRKMSMARIDRHFPSFTPFGLEEAHETASTPSRLRQKLYARVIVRMACAVLQMLVSPTSSRAPQGSEIEV